ncbi:MAG: hypothetical protein IPL55_21920 [Saprospiraceae bacterium]|nr:hypothetical protein [Saprospiraceae bacterium]MBL0025031.1 hypothetical protein [Saprospiraceae bacterium]
MIEENVKLHDKFSVELKLGFIARKKALKNNFTLNTWIFFPESLDINRFTYSKESFYNDLKSNIRLITPIFLLRDIAERKCPVFENLELSFQQLASQPTRTNKADYEYQIKMFLSILKSSLREEINHISNVKDEDIDYLLLHHLEYLHSIMIQYRALYFIINVPTVSNELVEYFNYGDEFMSNLVEYNSFLLLRKFKQRKTTNFEEQRSQLNLFIENELHYKKSKNYLTVERDNKKGNTEIVLKLGVLKKYMESHLFLNTDRQKDGILVEQLLFSLAAGISMVFATFIAFSVQRKFGNFTMPLFVALVVSYMLKDRIKEFTRYYLANKMSTRFFDHKIRISVHEKEVGWAKESMDFIHYKKLPEEVKECRQKFSILQNISRRNSEKAILFRTQMFIDRQALDNSSKYFISGINSIIRLNFTSFLKNMDNPDFPLYYPDAEKDFIIVKGLKLYYINLILQMKSEDQNELVKYRLAINRKGIHSMEKII